MVFDDLNRSSDIPIHQTSKKYTKLGSGVVYYNDPWDLLDWLELLGINSGREWRVKQEFSQIAHTLNKLGVINNGQLNDLVKEYVIIILVYGTEIIAFFVKESRTSWY